MKNELYKNIIELLNKAMITRLDLIISKGTIEKIVFNGKFYYCYIKENNKTINLRLLNISDLILINDKLK